MKPLYSIADMEKGLKLPEGPFKAFLRYDDDEFVITFTPEPEGEAEILALFPPDFREGTATLAERIHMLAQAFSSVTDNRDFLRRKLAEGGYFTGPSLGHYELNQETGVLVKTAEPAPPPEPAGGEALVEAAMQRLEDLEILPLAGGVRIPVRTLLAGLVSQARLQPPPCDPREEFEAWANSPGGPGVHRIIYENGTYEYAGHSIGEFEAFQAGRRKP